MPRPTELFRIFPSVSRPANNDVKGFKRTVLKEFGFAQDPTFNGRTVLSGWNSETNRFAGHHSLIECIHEKMMEYNVTLRYIDDGGFAGGGHPCVYINHPKDLSQLFYDDTGAIIGFRSLAGDEVYFDESGQLQVLTVKRSREKHMTNLKGAVERRQCKQGGSFTLQLNTVQSKNGLRYDKTKAGEDDTLVMTQVTQVYTELLFTLVTVYDDNGARFTHLACDESRRAPHTVQEVSIILRPDLTIEIGGLDDAFEDLMRSNSINAESYSLYLLSKLFKQDAVPFFNLFLNLYFQSPQYDTHSITGLFSDERCEVIDFDGADTSAAFLQKLREDRPFKNGSLQEDCIPDRSASQLLALSRLLLSNALHLAPLITERDRALTSQILNDHEKHYIMHHLAQADGSFSQNLDSEVVLGRLLKRRSIDWEVEEETGIKYLKKGNATLILVDIMGYCVAFWRDGKSEYVDCKGMLPATHAAERLRTRLHQIIGRNLLVQAELNYVREGD